MCIRDRKRTSRHGNRAWYDPSRAEPCPREVLLRHNNALSTSESLCPRSTSYDRRLLPNFLLSQSPALWSALPPSPLPEPHRRSCLLYTSPSPRDGLLSRM